MERNVLLGAPSLMGKGIHEAVKDAFAGDPFPLTVKVTNLTIAPLSFSEVRLFLDPFFGVRPSANVTFKDDGQLTRMLTDAAQIAELNQWTHLMTISDIDEVIAEVAQEATAFKSPEVVLENEPPVEAQSALEPTVEVVAEAASLLDADGLGSVPVVEATAAKEAILESSNDSISETTVIDSDSDKSTESPVVDAAVAIAEGAEVQNTEAVEVAIVAPAAATKPAKAAKKGAK